jgi:hypothetical protein
MRTCACLAPRPREAWEWQGPEAAKPRQGERTPPALPRFAARTALCRAGAQARGGSAA